MKKVALLLCAVLAVGLVFAGGAEHGKMAGNVHKMTVEIVSIDADAKTITVKDEKGENHTAPVMGKALETLPTVHAGEKVTVYCQDNEKGEHEGVIKILVPKEEKAPAK